MNTCRSTGIALGLLVTVSATLPASADVTCAEWTDNTHYCYQIAHMPDLDQKRNGLPNDGSMYCVPTAAMNMMAYISNHGFDEILPGPANYQSPANYLSATNAIGFMGIFMNTSATSGTNGSGWLAGIEAWIEPSDMFTWNRQYAAGWFSPSQELITGVGITGGLVQYSYGRYFNMGYLNGYLLQRQGGHSVTLSFSERNGGPGVVWCRDPGGDSDLATQSIFANTQHDLDVVLVNFNNGAFGTLRNMARINWPSSDGRFRLIDSFGVIRPKFGYSFTDTGVGTFAPFSFNGGLAGEVNDIPIPQTAPLVDALATPDGDGFVVLYGPDGPAPASYVTVSVLTGAVSPPVIVPDAIGMTLAWNRSAYVLLPTRLARHDLDNASAVLDTTVLPFEAKALVYNSATRDIAMISATDRKLMLVRASDLQQDMTVYSIPGGVPLDDPVHLAVNPTDGAIWLSSESSDKLYEMIPGQGVILDVVPVVHASLTAPRGIDFDDKGNLFVSNDGAVLEFSRSCPDCPWHQVSPSFFDGFEVGDLLHVSRSRTNFDPQLHVGPGFDNIDPDELEQYPSTPDCFGDTNGDGFVDFQDLLGLLANWGTDDWQHDIAPGGGDGIVNSTDLLGLLAAWGPCP